MGREAECKGTLGRLSGRGRALLETDDLIFRGAFRAKVPLREITSLEARGGALRVRWPGGTLVLELGGAAERWADAIRNPKSVLEKLGVKPGLRVAALGVRDATFLAQLAKALGTKPAARLSRRLDLVFVGLSAPADHAKLARVVEPIRPAGGAWAVYPRGRADVSEDTVRAAAKQAGLVDVKVVRFSETHGALKLVIPRASR